MQKILVLDDSSSFLDDISKSLTRWGYEPLLAKTAEEAVDLLVLEPAFVVVDLFLAGDAGDQLSNDFVRDHLMPSDIPFGRLTSAPRLVPEDFSGSWVLHKYSYLSDEDCLREKIIEGIG